MGTRFRWLSGKVALIKSKSRREAACLDIFGYRFARRYARFKRIFVDLFEVTLGEEFNIALKKPIKVQLIEEEWERIQHIICICL